MSELVPYLALIVSSLSLALAISNRIIIIRNKKSTLLVNKKLDKILELMGFEGKIE